MSTSSSPPAGRPVFTGRALVATGVGVAAVTLAGWAVGLGWATALLVALAFGTVSGLRRLPAINAEQVWPAPPEPSTDRGVRREVARLSWSLHGYESRVERPSLIRLRAVAERRLGYRGLHLDDPAQAAACRELLGPTAYATVTAGPRSHVTFEHFRRSLSVVESLAEERTP